MDHRNKPFLTVVSHPKGWTTDQIASLLHEASGLDRPTLTLKLRQPPPMIFAQVDPQAADLAIRALRQNGGDGMAVTLSNLEDMGTTIGLRDLGVDRGHVRVVTRSDESSSFGAAEIEFLIRATLAESKVRSRSETAISESVDRRMMSSPLGGVWRVGPRPSVGGTGSAGVERRITTTDLLDIHLHDGRILQIDGDRFSYEALGEMKGHSDKINMDRMRDLLSHLAPKAIVDDYFKLWRAPAGHHRLRLLRAGANDEPAFAFYSRWTALVYRHVSSS